MRQSLGVVTVLTLLLLPHVGEAQTERTDARLRDRCLQVNAALVAGPGHEDYQWARDSFRWCDVTGGSAVSDRWGKISAEDLGDLSQLMERTREFRDREVMTTLIALLQDPGRPGAVRRSALDILVTYYHPGYVLPSGAGTSRRPPAECTLNVRLYPRAINSTNPVRPDDKPQILAAIQIVAETPGEAMLRSIAECALVGIRHVR
jgi:hypothetical protein